MPMSMRSSSDLAKRSTRPPRADAYPGSGRTSHGFHHIEKPREAVAEEGVTLRNREPRKFLRHSAINLAAEWHDKIGDAIEALPAPGVELGRLAVALRQRIDLAVIAGEAHREPFLALAAEFGEAMLRTQILRKFVGEPVGFAEIADIADAGLFPQFAHHRRARVFVRIDAALRHLPLEAGQDDFRPVVAKTMADQH